MPSSLEASKSDRGIFGLFQGPSGAGKSVAAYSFPNCYVFDLDRKMPTIAKKHFPGTDIHWDTFEDIFEVAAKISEFAQNCPYETIVTDSVTALVNLTLNTVGKTKGEDVLKKLKSVTKGGNIELMGIDYYNAETNFIQRYWLEALKSLWSKEGNPKHVIVIAHVIESESAPDLKTKIVTKSRSIVTAGRKVAAYIPTVFDDVYTFAQEMPDYDSKDQKVKRICITESMGEDYSKTSYNLPARIDFTGKSLYQIMDNYAAFG